MSEAYVTPPYKSGGKRVVAAIEGLDLNNMDFSPEAIPITDRTTTNSQEGGVKNVLNVNDFDDIVVRCLSKSSHMCSFMSLEENVIYLCFNFIIYRFFLTMTPPRSKDW